MPLPRLVRNVALRVAHVVARDDLFEKPGERPPSAPLEPTARTQPNVLAGATLRAPVVAGDAAGVAPAPEAPEAPAVSRSKKGGAKKKARVSEGPARPVTGCVAVDLDGLKRALTPSGKPIVVNHWASWCDPCVDELPRLVRAAAGVADIGEFLGVSWDLFDHPGDADERARKVGAFADSVGVGYGSVLFDGEPSQLFKALKLDSELIPQTQVIAPDGTVVWKKNGVIDHDDVFPLIKAVKAAAGKA